MTLIAAVLMLVAPSATPASAARGSWDLIRPGPGEDVVEGGAGDDDFGGSVGADRFNGGPGSDYLAYFDMPWSLTLDVVAGTATSSTGERDTFVAVEEFFGTAYGNTMIGSDAPEVLRGGDGEDDIRGGGGDDDPRARLRRTARSSPTTDRRPPHAGHLGSGL